MDDCIGGVCGSIRGDNKLNSVGKDLFSIKLIDLGFLFPIEQFKIKDRRNSE
jgi:hypothetical protein